MNRDKQETLVKTGVPRDSRVSVLLILAFLLSTYCGFSGSIKKRVLGTLSHVNSKEIVWKLQSGNDQKLHVVSSNKKLSSQCIDFPRHALFSFKPIPINFSNQDLLMTVSGIGPRLAERIIAYRDEYGSIDRAESLLDIEGIGPKKLSKLRNHFNYTISL